MFMLIGDIVFDLPVCFDMATPLKILVRIDDTGYAARESFVIVHINMKILFPSFCGSLKYNPWNLWYS